MKEDSIFKKLHPDAQELYNSVCDLRATCKTCADPTWRVDSISLKLFHPVRPRLAKISTWTETDFRTDTKPWWK